MLGRRWSLAGGLSKTEWVQLIDRLGLAGTSRGAMDIVGGINTGLRLRAGSQAFCTPDQTRTAVVHARMPARRVG